MGMVLRNMLVDMQEHRLQGMLLRKLLDVFDACLEKNRFRYLMLSCLPKGFLFDCLFHRDSPIANIFSYLMMQDLVNS